MIFLNQTHFSALGVWEYPTSVFTCVLSVCLWGAGPQALSFSCRFGAQVIYFFFFVQLHVDVCTRTAINVSLSCQLIVPGIVSQPQQLFVNS